MSSIEHEIRRGAYYDSVVLMQLQRSLLELEGVEDAGVVMATAANLELLDDSGLLVGGLEPRPEDLLIVVKAGSETMAAHAIGQIDSILNRRRSAAASAYRPRSLDSAVKDLPEAAWVLISIPGRYAASVTRQALSHNKHVFLYSDNVSLEEEIELKTQARERGLLVMGPDCGTAIINGIGFGFANHVRRGAIGLVGASGTGLQAISSSIHGLGQGISHAIGTGGRDLKHGVNAITARQGLELLAHDPDTKVIVVVSKPPDPAVAASLLTTARQTGKPTVINFIGYAPPVSEFENLIFANTLLETAGKAVQALVGGVKPDPNQPHVQGQVKPGFLRGLFSGGTLAIEAVRGLQAFLGPIHTNLSVPGGLVLEDPLVSKGHTILDLGEDIFTVGRLHPMIDNDLRLRRMEQESSAEEVALILLDVVLGEGSHPDPASELGPAIEHIRQRGVDVGVLLIGTDEDPQDMVAQRSRLESAGAKVVTDTISLVAYAVALLGDSTEQDQPAISTTALAAPVAAINIGLESFYDSLLSQGAASIQVDWRPPAGGNERLIGILSRIKSSQQAGDQDEPVKKG